MPKNYTTQNELILKTLLKYYKDNNNIDKILPIIHGESDISLRLIDWFVTNYSKERFVVYVFTDKKGNRRRFKVYDEYKLKLKSYSKKRFDPFCRWDRINVPYKDDKYIQTTLGQLNFFKWILENKILQYIKKNKEIIEKDMNNRNSTAKKTTKPPTTNKTRKKRQELSVSASKSIKKENVEIVIRFDK